ncbi:MAG: M14 metallopeptidase family protein, partial [Fidelibacterota bacterium]
MRYNFQHFGKKQINIKLHLILIGIIISTFASISLADEGIKSPEQFFGFKMGTDRQLIDWNQIVEYFVMLGGASDRVEIEELGKTTLGKPFIMAKISSAENIKNLEHYRQIQLKIYDPRKISREEALKLADSGKVVVMITLNLHSTEIASSQESVELAYLLATADDPGTRKILDNVIILLIPSLNPDGQQMVVDWYNKYKDTPHEGSSMPWLYHHYAGHDNNRDWFMMNLAETRLTSKIYYHEWLPEIIFDQHQMGSGGARLFLPPYADPVNPNVHPLLLSEINMIGKYIVSELQEKGYKGVVTGTIFTAWWEGTSIMTPWWHNQVGILSEMASALIATPLYFPKGSLSGMGRALPEYKAQVNFLDPWEGGWWRLRDIIDYELAVTFSLLDLAATYRSKFILNFYRMNREAVNKGKTEPPYAYIITEEQNDPLSAVDMVNRLILGGVEVHRADKAFRADGKYYPEGTYVILLAQPFRPYVKDIMEQQRYPDISQYPGGPPIAPYDITGWTLPLQMGVTVETVEKEFSADLTPVKEALSPYKDLPIPENVQYYALDPGVNINYKAVNRLQKKKFRIYRSPNPLVSDGEEIPGGAFLIPAVKGIRTELKKISEELGVKFYGINVIEDKNYIEVKTPRIGLYQPWKPSMDEGWTRYVLDTFEFPYKILHNKQMKEEKLNEKYDVIILPDLVKNLIKKGYWGKEPPKITRGFPEIPDEYRGGIEDEGV